MPSDSQIASQSSPSPGATQPRSTADLIYQAITVVAALLLLGSLWAF